MSWSSCTAMRQTTSTRSVRGVWSARGENFTGGSKRVKNQTLARSPIKRSGKNLEEGRGPLLNTSRLVGLFLLLGSKRPSFVSIRYSSATVLYGTCPRSLCAMCCHIIGRFATNGERYRGYELLLPGSRPCSGLTDGSQWT